MAQTRGFMALAIYDSDSDSESNTAAVAPVTPPPTARGPPDAPTKPTRRSHRANTHPRPLSQLEMQRVVNFSFPDRRPQRKKPATQADLARQTGIKIKRKGKDNTDMNTAVNIVAPKLPEFNDKNFPELPEPARHHVDPDHLDALRRNADDVSTMNRTRKILDYVSKRENWQRRRDAFAEHGNAKTARKWAGPPPKDPFASPPKNKHKDEDEDDSYAFHDDDYIYDRVQHGIFDNAWSSDDENPDMDHDDDLDHMNEPMDDPDRNPYDPVGDGYYGRGKNGFGLKPRGKLVIDPDGKMRGKYGDQFYYSGPNATGDHTPAVATRDFHGRLRYAPATGDDIW